MKLYSLGCYVKVKYPTRYKNQLGTSRFLKFLPFPFNLSQSFNTGNTPGLSFKKIIEIANQENDQILLERAEKTYSLILFLINNVRVIILIFIVVTLFFTQEVWVPKVINLIKQF